MKKWLSILLIGLALPGYAALSGGGASVEESEIHTIKWVQHTKNIDVPNYVTKTIEVPEIKLVPREVIDPVLVPEEVKVQSVKVEEVKKVVEIPDIKYVKKEVEMPLLDMAKLEQDIQKFVEKIIADSLKKLDVKGMIKAAIDEATVDVHISNAVVTDVPVTNAVVTEKQVQVERPVFVNKEVINPVLREQVIKVKKIILEDGREL